jgi:radical SAM protein with 4Fe4S-binding SPASM domain
VEITKKYCGAVAVSWYRADYTYRAIDKLVKAGCTVNIHFVLGNNSIDEATERLANCDFPSGVNAVIFLLHKPVGQGTQENVLSVHDPRLEKFFREVDRGARHFQLGFDSCTVPGIVNFSSRIVRDTVEPCDAGRFSMYISPDMRAMTCSFDNQQGRWGVDLRTHSIQQAWDHMQFELFRNHSRHSCPDCSGRTNCYGGCPITPEITLCDKPTRTHQKALSGLVPLNVRRR